MRPGFELFLQRRRQIGRLSSVLDAKSNSAKFRVRAKNADVYDRLRYLLQFIELSVTIVTLTFNRHSHG